MLTHIQANELINRVHDLDEAQRRALEVHHSSNDDIMRDINEKRKELRNFINSLTEECHEIHYD